jgi:hypothetical protein
VRYASVPRSSPWEPRESFTLNDPLPRNSPDLRGSHRLIIHGAIRTGTGALSTIA